MLRTVHVTRHAPSVSPFSEQRLLFAVNKSNVQSEGSVNNDNIIAPTQAVEQKIATIQTEFRHKLFEASGTHPWQVLSEYKHLLVEKTGEAMKPRTENEVCAILDKARLAVKQEIQRETQDHSDSIRALANIDLDTLTEESAKMFVQEHKALVDCYFRDYEEMSNISIVLQLDGLLKWQLDLLRNTDITVDGMRWRLRGKEGIEQEMRINNGLDFDENNIPSAFITPDTRTITINIDAPEFQDSEYGKQNIERVVAHETTHQAVHELGKPWLRTWEKAIKEQPKEWEVLESAVHNVFNEDSKNTGVENNNPLRILDEALAITLTNTRHGFEDAKKLPTAKRIAYEKQEIVRKKLTAFIGGNDLLEAKWNELEAKYTNLRKGGMSVEQIEASIQERAMNKKLEEMFVKPSRRDGQKAQTNGGRSMTPEQGSPEELAKVMEEESNKKAVENQSITAEQTISQIDEFANRAKTAQETYLPIMKDAMKDVEDKNVLFAIIEKNNELLIEAQEDFHTIRRYVDILARWNDKNNPATLEEKKYVASQFPENPYENLGESVNASSIIEVDKACVAEREKFLKSLKESVQLAEKPIQVIEEMMGRGNEVAQTQKGNASTGFQGWLQKNMMTNPHGPVMWMTPQNILKVISIYKESIVEYYKSNQTPKEYNYAKNMNIFKNIDHTLKKQARSANNDESGKFLDYLKAEGYEFDEIFGEDGEGKKSGVLYENRGNFNKAKAVIEYAADNGWLYKLDRFNGNDVYGIEFEKIEGSKSFDELVERYEAAKSKLVDLGKKKVGHDPDVPLIMQTMIEEIEKKNIFVVQGIMERLQGKAKYSHSPTWMLATLLLMMRDNPKLRVCFDKGFMDNVSNATIGQAAWSITWLKMTRHELRKWIESGNDSLFGNNPITKTILDIEKQFEKEGVEFTPDVEGFKQKTEAIGIILSGKTYQDGHQSGRMKASGKTAPRRPISIFDNIFNEYREKFRGQTTNKEIDPNKTDGDYFDHEQGGSDVLLLGKFATFKILSKESQGKFNYQPAARGYIAQLCDRIDELGECGLQEAKENLRKEAGEKITYWIENNVIPIANAVKSFQTDEDGHGKKMVTQLEERGIITKELAETIRKK